MAGPCCCKSNVEAAKVLGIIYAILSLLGTFNGGAQNIAQGVISCLISLILVYGAHTRNGTAILVWMVLVMINLVWIVIIVILAIIALVGGASGSLIGLIVIYIGLIFYVIWTLIVAKNARKEIEN